MFKDNRKSHYSSIGFNSILKIYLNESLNLNYILVINVQIKSRLRDLFCFIICKIRKSGSQSLMQHSIN